MTRGARRTVAVLIIAGAGIAAVPATSVLGAAPAPALTANVSIVPNGGTCTALFCFKPPFVKTANNNAVSWVNRSTTTHTITRCTPAACSGHGGGTGTDVGFGATSVAPNQRYTFTFDATGTYLYYCAIHGYTVMHGTISVH